MMHPDEFEDTVEYALGLVPPPFQAALSEVAVLIDDDAPRHSAVCTGSTRECR